MKKWFLLLSFLAVGLMFFSSCTKSKTVVNEVNEFAQSYMYDIRDGKIKEVYDNKLSSKMKEVVTFDDFKERVSSIYKGKIGKELRVGYAQIEKEKSTGDINYAIVKMQNMGRMGKVMDADKSLQFTLRCIIENGQWKIEQEDYMAELTAEKEETARLNSLLKNYSGLIKIEELIAEPNRDRAGWATIKGTILNGSDDLDMVKVGIKIKFKDKDGEIIYGAKFFPVLDVRYEGLRTSILPGHAKVFEVPLKDIPETWDSSQPLDYSFYLVDGVGMTKEELDAEIADRAKIKKEIESAKRSDEEARKQLKEMWEREKKLKAKINALKSKKN